ncbi:glycosyltransferase family 2 protein [Pseudodesulfovibrio senegalensis]|uniref:Glycosyltransferase family 2 protein n=1 Tax=Pseudodesulfovibrio senegalensis TaxID=1721087 RepID=A0A6N6N1R9_9BACT|nr:glycosyltransferase family 2 protein [Pseudodesulfovibrio senegalensis]KAB1440834.1 glycosyltransferase family 2 protein [Pseudodesulfovibrio senegalensis]
MDHVVLSIVIPVFNKFALTRDCLNSLAQHPPGVEFEVIVVDNGSSDETAAQLGPLGESLFPGRFRHIRLEQNSNFGPACNLGARSAHGSHLFFLNNDTLLTPDWCAPLMDALSNGAGIAGPLLAYPESVSHMGERVQHLGVACLPRLHPCHLYEFFPVDHAVVRKKRSLQFLTGAAMLLPRAVFLQAGMFCEQYVNGGEDLDLCVQVRKNGHELAFVPESRIYHLQSQTSGRHDHERHNAQVLRERCLRHMYPDFHFHLRRDGYEIALNEMMTPVARLPERRRELIRKSFLRETDQPDENACLRLMVSEPLFLPAYERLAAIRAGQGDHAAVVSIRFLQTRLFPSRVHGRLLVNAAQKAGDQTMRTEAQTIVAQFDHAAKDKNLGPMAQELERHFKQLNMPELATLYAHWVGE